MPLPHAQAGISFSSVAGVYGCRVSISDLRDGCNFEESKKNKRTKKPHVLYLKLSCDIDPAVLALLLPGTPDICLPTPTPPRVRSSPFRRALFFMIVPVNSPSHLL